MGFCRVKLLTLVNLTAPIPSTNMFTRFDTKYERDRRTDGQTGGQTPHDGIGRAMDSVAQQNQLETYGRTPCSHAVSTVILPGQLR